MILESVAIDFRCSSCGTIRRLDADLSCTVASHLPTGWKVFNKPWQVCCSVCCEIENETRNRITVETARQRRDEESGRRGSVQGDAGPEDERYRRADEKREKMKDIRMSTEERASLDPPPKTAPMPAVPGTCSHCGMVIGDEDADWRADSWSTVFVKIHTRCFRERASKHQAIEPDGES